MSLLAKTSMLLQRPAQTQNCAGSVGARPRPGRARVVPRRCSPPTLASTTPRLLPCEWGQRSQKCHRQGTLHCRGMPESLCPPCPGGGPLSTVLRSDTCGHGSPGPGDLSGQCPRLSLTLWCPGGSPHTLRARLQPAHRGRTGKHWFCTPPGPPFMPSPFLWPRRREEVAEEGTGTGAVLRGAA